MMKDKAEKSDVEDRVKELKNMIDNLMKDSQNWGQQTESGVNEGIIIQVTNKVRLYINLQIKNLEVKIETNSKGIDELRGKLEELTEQTSALSNIKDHSEDVTLLQRLMDKIRVENEIMKNELEKRIQDLEGQLGKKASKASLGILRGMY